MAAKIMNVVNLEAVDAYCRKVTAGLSTDGARKWMTRRLRAAVLSADFLEPFTPMAAASRVWPAWVSQRLDEGVPLWLFPEGESAPGRAEFDRRAARLANYLTSLEAIASAKLNPADPLFNKKQEDREEAGRTLSDLPKLTIPDAEAAADQWFDRLRRRIAQKEPAKDATTLMAEHGFRIVRIRSPAGLDRESSLMGNCVGSGLYDLDVKSGRVLIASVRDAANEPHATLELRQDGGHPTLFQAKGRQNSPISPRYAGIVVEFLESINARLRPCCHDLSETGIMYCGGHFIVTTDPARGLLVASDDGVDIFLMATGPDVYLLSAPDGKATIEVGAEGGLVGLWSDLPAARMPVCCRLLNVIARRERPSTGATSSLARQGLYHDGKRFVTLKQALTRTTGTWFANGDRLVTMVNRETSQETLWYVRHGKLAAILTTNAAGGGNRLYVAEAGDEFSGPEVAGNVFGLLEQRNALLADSAAAARLGLVFFALIGRYTTLESMAEVATEALTGLDCILTLEHAEGRTILRLNRRLHRVADIFLDGAGRITPFLAVDSVVGVNLRRDFKWVLSVLNALGFAAGRGDVGSGIFFHRATRLFMSRDAFMAKGGLGGAKLADLRNMVASSWRKTAATILSQAHDGLG
ncbi:MAG: PcfJ domain-containing protein [Rhodospirillaceae bacterium]